MICNRPADKQPHEHSHRVEAIAQVMHSSECGSHDGRKDVAAARWSADLEHRHRDCTIVENFIHYMAVARDRLPPDSGAET